MVEGAVYTLRRDRLEDGRLTTLYVVRYPRAGLRIRARVFRQPRRLDHWCSRHRVHEAIVGGFYRRDPFRPLGELWLDGREVRGERFHPPYGAVRPALHAAHAGVRIARREALPECPSGDLLQAGPLLVDEGRIVFDPASDDEGFSVAAEQFDSDITAGRPPPPPIRVGDRDGTPGSWDGPRRPPR